MKKSILASSIAAAVFGLGAITTAQAAESLASSSGTGNYGIGDALIVPYFSTQDANATLLSIINTDTQNGKAVKVRFRGAANSDDLFDFQVFLSPKDVWTANVSKGAGGLSQLTTSDASCTKPAATVLNSTPFVTGRLNQTLSADALANNTREGYIEIIGMADIPPNNLASGSGGLWTANLRTTPLTDAKVVAGTALTTDNPLFFATKHASGVAPCTGTAWTDLDKTTAFKLTNSQSASVTVPAAAATLGMVPLSGGLLANWTIVNTTNAAAFGGEAIAITSDVAQSSRQVIYAPQIANAVAAADMINWSADPLFRNANTTAMYNLTLQGLETAVGTSPVFAAGHYDLPDLSTSLESGGGVGNPETNITAITSALAARTSILNEFAIESAISGSTDWVFSMPTRRYSVAMAYSKISATYDGRVWNTALNSVDETVKNQFTRANTSIVGGLICVTGANPAPTNREETSPSSSAAVVVSPSTVAGSVKLCGETSVLSFNQGNTATSASLKANVAVTNVDVGYATGWATMSVAASNTVSPAVGRYPIAGGVFQRAQFGTQGFGIFRPFR